MSAKDFPKWYEAWQQIKSPVRRRFHLTGLLTGARPGELSRTCWQDIDDEDNMLAINAKVSDFSFIGPLFHSFGSL
jgi:integrase